MAADGGAAWARIGSPIWRSRWAARRCSIGVGLTTQTSLDSPPSGAVTRTPRASSPSAVTRPSPPNMAAYVVPAADGERAQHDAAPDQPIVLGGRSGGQREHLLADEAVRRGADRSTSRSLLGDG